MSYLCSVIKNKVAKFKKIKDMKAQVGRYYFGRHYSSWGIWQWDVVDENGFTSANHINDVHSYEEAVKTVYRLNGWGEPKTIKRTF